MLDGLPIDDITPFDFERYIEYRESLILRALELKQVDQLKQISLMDKDNLAKLLAEQTSVSQELANLEKIHTYLD